MIEIFYRYRVHPAQTRAFEHAYGAAGPWAKLFAKHSGFKRTRLFRHKTDASIYVTVDVWASKADYDAFRSAFSAEYTRLDKQLAMLKLEEHLLGYYAGEDEYHSPIDTQA
ncbi:MAG: antibiotic biosynthesis monooxygenase family protein [Vulcanimicrobiaceae bacterium]